MLVKPRSNKKKKHPPPRRIADEKRAVQVDIDSSIDSGLGFEKLPHSGPRFAAEIVSRGCHRGAWDPHRGENVDELAEKGCAPRAPRGDGAGGAGLSNGDESMGPVDAARNLGWGGWKNGRVWRSWDGVGRDEDDRLTLITLITTFFFFFLCVCL
jgi:hypothetical protein